MPKSVKKTYKRETRKKRKVRLRGSNIANDRAISNSVAPEKV